MRALVIAEGRVRVESRPDPEPGPGHVLVRVRGAGINRADLAQRAGRYPAPPGSPPDIPGLEVAGEVVALGDGVTAPAVGTRVFALVGGGGQAELAVVPAEHCAIVPDMLDLLAASGVPEVFITAHDALVTVANAHAGETVYVSAVGSGVGTAALQLARTLGLTTAGSARTTAKLDRATELGLDHALLAPRELDPLAFAEQLVAVAGRIDVALDLVGGPYLEAEVHAAGPRGRIVLISTSAGMRATLDIGQLMGKRLQVHGTVLRARDLEEKAAATAGFVRDVVPRLADGSIVPVVAEVVALDDAERGYELLAADAVFGKIVLDCS